MFDNLFKLYRNNTGKKTPLEDFTTESLANIFILYPNIANDFCINFLKLPKDNYKVSTQYYQHISTKASNCIIDLVFLSKNHVCFVENKVESLEGKNQLKRYTIALQENHLKKKKYLRYCTKYADPKTINQDYVDFSQYRWYELAHFLSRYEENLLIKTYLDFLYNNNMSQDNTIKSEQLLTIEHLRKTIEIIEFHIDNSKSNFSKFFGAASNINKNTNWNQIKSQNRICFYQENVLVSKTNQYSEVLYAIEFDELKMVTQIYVDKKHEQYPNIVNEIVEGVFIKSFFEYGVALRLEENLANYLNNTDGDKLIQEWYYNSFNKLKQWIKNTSNLQWHDYIKN
ncbi:PD-(D/E)XK nuclease superfamily protein [Tenacibaculum mesophilum]|uniref:PD-(D/E)XK nuclease superfamily protein n=1 Tax=Tenacibaculum mesophilum TaxID=104268 RepID=A0ABM7CES1_9FLAO|nr:PD-(D/E)XK nuclease family protein [Tenacibaculum mesophilum]AZJ32254.1 hypothetical protein D6200_06645 [Tenacibaculum mesophilum]QFS27509.1 hypothetical protein F9Y86_03500 [Tenacibaculum mesophilum]SHG19064.1 PD-(D/E)XK nuclease superfamily protein [Tenacibaculum mesophilum]